MLFGPLAALLGAWTWPGLRIVNALLGAAAIGFVTAPRAMRGAESARRWLAAGVVRLFGHSAVRIGTARNDALPAALLATALPLMVRAAQGKATARTAALAGLLLAAAGAAKISYALPARLTVFTP